LPEEARATRISGAHAPPLPRFPDANAELSGLVGEVVLDAGAGKGRAPIGRVSGILRISTKPPRYKGMTPHAWPFPPSYRADPTRAAQEEAREPTALAFSKPGGVL